MQIVSGAKTRDKVVQVSGVAAGRGEEIVTELLEVARSQ